jgi:hypothetical protein
MVENWGEKWGENWGAMASSLLRSMVELAEIVSDVSCHYSLGTNPRGVKDYTLAAILIGLRLFSL